MKRERSCYEHGQKSESEKPIEQTNSVEKRIQEVLSTNNFNA